MSAVSKRLGNEPAETYPEAVASDALFRDELVGDALIEL